MKNGSLFICIALIIIGNLTFQLFWGERGWFAYSYLQDQQQMMEFQMDRLERNNGILQERLEQLKSDRNTLRQEAGRLHYLSQGEILVLVSGLEEAVAWKGNDEIYKFSPRISSYRKSFFRGVSITIGLAALLVQLLFGRFKGNKEEKPLSHIL